jgi:hypothetical protein
MPTAWPVQFEILDFGFEVQDLSNFKISAARFVGDDPV